MMWYPNSVCFERLDANNGDVGCAMDPQFVVVAPDFTCENDAGKEEETQYSPSKVEKTESQSVIQVHCLQIGVYDGENDRGPAGLILTRDENTGCYRRVGLYHYDPDFDRFFIDDPIPHERYRGSHDAMREEQQRGLTDIEPVTITII